VVLESPDRWEQADRQATLEEWVLPDTQVRQVPMEVLVLQVVRVGPVLQVQWEVLDSVDPLEVPDQLVLRALPGHQVLQDQSERLALTVRPGLPEL